jgi:hypothetical protein
MERDDTLQEILLPTQIGGNYTRLNGQEKATLESWGFEFGEPLIDDLIFRNAKLPKDWKDVATSS